MRVVKVKLSDKEADFLKGVGETPLQRDWALSTKLRNLVRIRMSDVEVKAWNRPDESLVTRDGIRLWRSLTSQQTWGEALREGAYTPSSLPLERAPKMSNADRKSARQKAQ